MGTTLERAILPSNGLEDSRFIDILDRQEVVTQLKELLITLSDARSSCTFALNGEWGIGKTFVLRMLEQQLQDYQAGNKFTVFHYNCWEYDYYDEPIIAIVSAMLDNIDDQTHLLSQEIRDGLQTGFEMARNVLQTVACSIIENKIGIDVSGLTESVEVAAVGEKESYDQYYAFNRVMAGAREELSKLSEVQTLVIVVDELDRCLPQYAIKVLERLHHLFSDLCNTVVILGIDAKQLDNAITHIFGPDTKTKKYLKKFINFEMMLDRGSINAEFREKYCDYFQLFDETALASAFPVDSYLTILFSGIDVRTQEHLMDRIKMVHSLLIKEEKKDFSFMCFELMLLVFAYSSIVVKPFSLNEEGSLMVDSSIPRALAKFLSQNWRPRRITRNTTENALCFDKYVDIPELMVWYAQGVYGRNGHPFCQLPKDLSDQMEEGAAVKQLKQVKQLLEIIA